MEIDVKQESNTMWASLCLVAVLFCAVPSEGCKSFPAVSCLPSSSCAPAPVDCENCDLCTKHYLMKRVRPVYDECIKLVPVHKKRVIHKPVIVTERVPVERNVIEHVREKYVEHVPVVRFRCRPVFRKVVHHIPITVTKMRPVSEDYVVHVPYKHKCLKNLEERVVVAKKVPCPMCSPDDTTEPIGPCCDSSSSSSISTCSSSSSFPSCSSSSSFPCSSSSRCCCCRCPPCCCCSC